MDLSEMIERKSAVIGVIGLGYVGLPLLAAFHRAGFEVIGFDVDPQKIEQATHKTVRQKVKLKSGFDKDTAKSIQKRIKELKLKVNASIQGDALRVSGSKRDDLQAVPIVLGI
jgi:uncharacterized protein YajQ (UPF0234 family)